MPKPADFDVSSQTTETAAVAAIRALSPECFLNLLTAACDVAIGDCGAVDRTGFSIAPEIGSIQRREHAEGVQFSICGRLETGTPRRFDVRVHGVNTERGVEFISIERAYDRQGRPSDTFFEHMAVAA